MCRGCADGVSLDSLHANPLRRFLDRTAITSDSEAAGAGAMAVTIGYPESIIPPGGCIVHVDLLHGFII